MKAIDLMNWKTATRRHKVLAGPTLAMMLTLAIPRGISAPPANAAYTTWSDYGGSADSMQYSALNQINKANINQIELAWSYLVPGRSSRFGFNPLIVDGVMYVLGRDNSLVALDAATGKQIWSHPTEGMPTDRGINYWESKNRSDRRLIFAANSFLQEVNARTGVTIPSFGNDGRVDLREGLGRDPKSIARIQSSTPGRVFENLIILGSATGEQYESPPGDLRAYDVLTGKLLWTFHTVPRPGEFGYETWPPDAWKYAGGTNTWGELSIDEKRGIAYFPLGSPTFDLYGGDRIGANLFGDCLLALDARTGKHLWHFQLVHHDLWDYDATTAPKLLTVRHNGKLVDVVAQATKFGFVYVFDRVTGEPLWPIEERPVPKSDMPGEQSWPTQPFPTKPPPFIPQKFSVNDLSPYIPEAEKASLREILLTARNEGIFTPPSLGNQIAVPGEFGGANWGGAAADPRSGMMYVRAQNAPTLHKLTPKPPLQRVQGGTPAQQGRALYTQLCESCHGADRAGHTGSVPSLVNVSKELGADRIKTAAKGGQGEMPGFTELLPRDLDALAAYLADPGAGEVERGRRSTAPPPPPPPGIKLYYGRLGALWNASDGLPAIAPPWSVLTAYDLNEGTIKWQVPAGTIPALAEKGIKNTGSYFHRNGIVATAGGLIFAASSNDRTLRAFDKDTGRMLWEKELPSNPEGIPAVYAVGGREYVAFCARSVWASEDGEGSIAWKPGDPAAQGYYVFALPLRTGTPR